MAEKNVKILILDTNIIIRYLIDDVKSQADEVEKLFKKAEDGKIELVMLPVIVAEVSYVLQSFYHESVSNISKQLQSILMQPWIRVEHEKAMLGMWNWYERGQHFVDSYLLALEKFEKIEIVSFDKKLNKLRKA